MNDFRGKSHRRSSAMSHPLLVNTQSVLWDLEASILGVLPNERRPKRLSAIGQSSSSISSFS